jgi:chromosome segregation ATPase
MMKSWGNLFRLIILMIGFIVLFFVAQLYNIYKQQKNEITVMSDQQKVEALVNSHRFKYQQDQIEDLKKNLEDAGQQIKEQKDESQGLQTSLVDIKAEADAIKQEMKKWQKDYVAVLAELEKKMDDAQLKIKNLEVNLADLHIPELREDINSLKADVEKITHPPDNSLAGTPPAPEKKIEDAPQESK